MVTNDASFTETTTLPAGWRWAKLGEVAKYVNGRAFKPTDWEINGLPIIRIQNLTNPNAEYHYFSQPVEEKYIVQTGDLLISWSATLDTFIWSNGKAVLNQHIFRVVPDDTKIDKIYLFFAVRTFLDKLKDQVHGTGMQHITRAPFESTTIPLPPLSEQKLIVSKLENLLQEIRTARQALERIPTLLKTFRQSVLAAAFRGELTERDPGDEPAQILLERICAERRRKWEENLRSKGKDPANYTYEEPAAPDTSNLPELPEGWVWTTLEVLLNRIEAGHSFKAEGRPARNGEYGVIKVSAMTWGKFLPEENKALLPDTDPGDTPRVQKGDLLISRANTVQLVGAVVLVQEDYPNLLLSDKSLRLVPITEEISREFLLYALKTHAVRDVFEGEATGVSESMRNITQDKIRNAPIALPSVQEQARIIEKIKEAYKQTNLIEYVTEVASYRLEKLEQAALSKAFRGRL